MLILAYADWCGHCKNFKPTWNEFRRKYENVLDIREIEESSNKEIMQELGVRGFPTIMLLNNGKKITYKEADRDMLHLENFVKNNLNSHVKADLKDYRSAN